jgi:hypothetical protein
MQPDVGNISNPYLIGPYYLQPLKQIGIPGERMMAVGGSLPLPVNLSLEPQFSHDTPYPLAVDPPALAL